jgi:hypothetical protein
VEHLEVNETKLEQKLKDVKNNLLRGKRNKFRSNWKLLKKLNKS